MAEPTASGSGPRNPFGGWVRIIRTGHIKGRVELMSMRIGKILKVVMIARVEEMRM
jgi:hypothetical protein